MEMFTALVFVAFGLHELSRAKQKVQWMVRCRAKPGTSIIAGIHGQVFKRVGAFEIQCPRAYAQYWFMENKEKADVIYAQREEICVSAGLEKDAVVMDEPVRMCVNHIFGPWGEGSDDPYCVRCLQRVHITTSQEMNHAFTEETQRLLRAKMELKSHATPNETSI